MTSQYDDIAKDRKKHLNKEYDKVSFREGVFFMDKEDGRTSSHLVSVTFYPKTQWWIEDYIALTPGALAPTDNKRILDSDTWKKLRSLRL